MPTDHNMATRDYHQSTLDDGLISTTLDDGSTFLDENDMKKNDEQELDSSFVGRPDWIDLPPDSTTTVAVCALCVFPDSFPRLDWTRQPNYPTNPPNHTNPWSKAINGRQLPLTLRDFVQRRWHATKHLLLAA
jgi:hypothetical protein